MTDAETGGKLVALIFLIKAGFISGVQTGRDSAAGKDFNKDLGAGLDSLIATPLYIRVPTTLYMKLQK